MTDSKRRVLVVEDDLDIRCFVTDALAWEGYEVQQATNGYEALAVLSEWRADVVLLDLMMPCCDGWMFRAEQLARVDLASIPVLVMSAAHDAQRETDKLQATAVIPKPFELDRLLATVKRLAI